MLKVVDLCDAAKKYILNISVGNKNQYYFPYNTSLVKDYILESKNKVLYWNSSGVEPTRESSVETHTATYTTVTSENIPTNLTDPVYEDRILSDWNNFVSNYITTKLKLDTPVSLTNFLLFMYLVRCFVDARYIKVSDSYNKKSVLLYNTSTDVNYNVDTTVDTFSIKNLSISLAELDIYIKAISSHVFDRQSSNILRSTINYRIS